MEFAFNIVQRFSAMKSGVANRVDPGRSLHPQFWMWSCDKKNNNQWKDEQTHEWVLLYLIKLKQLIGCRASSLQGRYKLMRLNQYLIWHKGIWMGIRLRKNANAILNIVFLQEKKCNVSPFLQSNFPSLRHISRLIFYLGYVQTVLWLYVCFFSEWSENRRHCVLDWCLGKPS